MPTHEDDGCPYGSYSPESTCNCVFCERNRLKALVREMGRILNATLPLTLAASDWAIRYEIEVLNDEALAVNAMFFLGLDDGIMVRPEVKAIMEEGK